MGVDGKYGRVSTERGTIAHDEPVVVFRAQDQTLPQLLRLYHTLCLSQGSPQRHLDRITKTISEVEAWQSHHYTKIPTSDMLDSNS